MSPQRIAGLLAVVVAALACLPACDDAPSEIEKAVGAAWVMRTDVTAVDLTTCNRPKDENRCARDITCDARGSFYRGADIFLCRIGFETATCGWLGCEGDVYSAESTACAALVEGKLRMAGPVIRGRNQTGREIGHSTRGKCNAEVLDDGRQDWVWSTYLVYEPPEQNLP